MTSRRRLFVVAAFVYLSFSIASSALAAATADPGASETRLPSGAGLHRDALLIRSVHGTSAAVMASIVATAGAAVVGRMDQIDTLVVTAAGGRSRAEVMHALAANRGILAVEADASAHLTLTPNDPYWSEEWFARKVRVDRVWDTTVGNGGPVIAVLDTGVQASQPDLESRVLPGHDFVNDDSIAADDEGHGTRVAGVANAVGMNRRGVAGMCWGCRILPVKVADRKGDVLWSNAAAGLIWATDHGARVVNMSFGRSSGSATMAAAVYYAHKHGVVVVAAAGNEGNSDRFYPAAYPGVLSVAATDKSDNLYAWSTRGDWVRVAAPGCAWTTWKGTNWGSFCGTSAAAPTVAGAAGLLLAVRPRATRSEVILAIVTSAARVTPLIGGGRLNAYSALQMLVSGG
jgi:subtilisin family serine protease